MLLSILNSLRRHKCTINSLFLLINSDLMCSKDRAVVLQRAPLRRVSGQTRRSSHENPSKCRLSRTAPESFGHFTPEGSGCSARKTRHFLLDDCATVSPGYTYGSSDLSKRIFFMYTSPILFFNIFATEKRFLSKSALGPNQISFKRVIGIFIS